MSEAEFKEKFAGSAVLRAKRRGLARSAALALGNSGNPAACEPLAEALLGDLDPLVRAHAAWALGRLGAAEADSALLRARAAESVPPVRREIDRAVATRRA